MLRCALALFAVLSVPLFAQDEPVVAPPGRPAVTGTIDAVTVYRGQALVTRLVDVPAGEGPRELVVTGLPERLVMNSLYAEAEPGASVRSVTYRVRPVSADLREEVRKLDEQIVTAQDAVNANQRQLQLVGERKAYLDRVDQFSAPTAVIELKNGVLNAETLKTLTVFVFEQRQLIATEELRLAIDRRTLGESLQTLQRQRAELTGGSARTVREAVVFVDAPVAGAKIRLRYLVDGASWSPSYNVRAADDRKAAVTVEYNAAVQQMSGEDWTGVAMLLSTATPSLVASAPSLEPLMISLIDAEVGQDNVRFDYKAKKLELSQLRLGAEGQRNSMSATMPGQPQAAGQVNGPYALDNDADLNRVADQLQRLEFFAKDAGDGKSSSLMFVGGTDAQTVSVTYALPGRTSLPSRSDQQLIQIASLSMEGQFYKLATPVLTSQVYEQAMLTNSSKLVLLAGTASSYVGGQFVGGGKIPTVAVGESFTVGFGIDSSLRASRTLVGKTESMQGGNKVIDFDYLLAIENFGTTPAEVRLIDRIPTTNDPNVKITQVSATVDLSKDESYTPTDRKAGMLRWDLQVPAGTLGNKAVTVGHKYRIEHDRQMSIGPVTAR